MPYHITRSPRSKKYYAVLLNEKGEVLSETQLLTRKENVFRNIVAQIDEIYAPANEIHAVVQDDSVTPMKKYNLYDDGRREKNDSPLFPKYIPGKNPKKKK